MTALLVLDEVLDLDVLGLADDFGAAGIGILGLDLGQFVLDDLPEFFLGGQDALQHFDGLDDFLVLVLDLLDFQIGQLAQLHFQDGLGLDGRKLEILDEGCLGVLGGLGGPDGLDDLVQVVEGDAQAFQDMGALLGLVQVKPGAADDHFLAVFQVVVEQAFQVQDARLAVDQGQHDDAERCPKRGLL